MGLLRSPLKAIEEEQARGELTLSQACERLVRMPEPGLIEPFSLATRRAWVPVYDSPFKYEVFATGRQIGKSTLLGNRMVVRSAMIPFLASLYVSPTMMQTTKFSDDRIRAVLHFSPELSTLKGNLGLPDSQLMKRFQNGSQITLRYAFLNADRIRGVFAHELYLDEYQDLLLDVIPVIEQCLFNAKEAKTMHYAGTFKSNSNPLTDVYYNQSTRMEWCVPCRCHPFTYYNILGMENVGSKGLVCDRCGNPIDPNDDGARWLSDDPTPDKKKDFMGWRLPQIAMKCDWDKLLMDMRRFSTAQFYNDTLALPYDSGMRALSLQQLQAVCAPDIFMSERGPAGSRDLPHWKKRCVEFGGYAGVDWGAGSRTGYTNLTIGTYGGRSCFTTFYNKRYSGTESDPEFALNDIIRTCREYNVQLIGLDYGYGFGVNDRVLREFGQDRAFKFEYVTSSQKAVWDEEASRFKINRTELMADLFSALKRVPYTFEFPRFEDFHDPWGKNFLAVYQEENASLRSLVYNHSPNEPDDAVHSTLYAFLVACMHYPRLDFFNPVAPRGR